MHPNDLSSRYRVDTHQCHGWPMEFLVKLTLNRDDIPLDGQQDLFELERTRTRELKRDGVILRMWAVPEGTHTFSLWQARDAPQVVADIDSLPLRRWMNVEVSELAPHYLELDT